MSRPPRLRSTCPARTGRSWTVPTGRTPADRTYDIPCPPEGFENVCKKFDPGDDAAAGATVKMQDRVRFGVAGLRAQHRKEQINTSSVGLGMLFRHVDCAADDCFELYLGAAKRVRTIADCHWIASGRPPLKVCGKLVRDIRLPRDTGNQCEKRCEFQKYLLRRPARAGTCMHLPIPHAAKLRVTALSRTTAHPRGTVTSPGSVRAVATGFDTTHAPGAGKHECATKGRFRAGRVGHKSLTLIGFRGSNNL